MTGQMSLFDIVGEDQKAEFDIKLPNVGEFEKETKLSFEKDVLGIYLSGHPMEEYEEKWKASISKTTLDFQYDEELRRSKVHEGMKEIVGGMIAEKRVKYTKNNQMMAYLTLEDLMGSIEVIVFPRDYMKYQQYLTEENKVFIKGRVQEVDEDASKLICESVIPFDQTSRELWIQYPDKDTYLKQEKELLEMLSDSDGRDSVIIYCKKEKAVKRLPAGRAVNVDKRLLSRLTNYLGESSVKVVEKSIENRR